MAFRYLEEEGGVEPLTRENQLEGYQVYMVEQWACSRIHPTFVIATYTGNSEHKITVGVLAVPNDETRWSPRLRVYFKSLSQFHARPKETPLGIIMVTNLSSFPSALNVIAVADGNVKAHRQKFIINENLKRMGCTGRSAISLEEPSDAAKSKFQQLFKTSDKVQFETAVIELVRLVQRALCLFSKMGAPQVDGLLCDVTENAINFWWSDYGTEWYNVEPSDGVLGPTTVAGLLGMVLGVRNRLAQCGSPVPKDALDIDGMKRAIAHFQKHNGLSRTRRLDRATLDKIYKATQKSGNSSTHFPVRAIKSTVQDIQGKVSGSGKEAGNTAIETTDIDKFILNVSGERGKFLWMGKKRKSSLDNGVAVPPAVLPKPAGVANSVASSKQGNGASNPIAEEGSTKAVSTHSQGHSSAPAIQVSGSPNTSEVGARDPLRKTMFRTMTQKSNEQALVQKESGSRSLGGKLKDAVHSRRHSRSKTKDQIQLEKEEIQHHRRTMSEAIPRNDRDKGDESDAGSRRSRFLGSTSSPAASRLQLPQAKETRDPSPLSRSQSRARSTTSEAPSFRSIHEPKVKDQEKSVPSVSINPTEVSKPRGRSQLRFAEESQFTQSSLRRARSFSRINEFSRSTKHDAYYPRRLSFSMAEDLIFGPSSSEFEDDGVDIEASLTRSQMAVAEIESWTAEQLARFSTLDGYLNNTLELLKKLETDHQENISKLEQSTVRAIPEAVAPLQDMLREVETLGETLQYEVQALRGKVREVEEVVGNYGVGVERVEDKAQVLEGGGGEKISWWEWGMRIVRGRG